MSAPAVHGKHQAEWITISSDEYDSMKRTIDVLSYKELMTQIREGKCKETPSRDLETLAKELGI
jgi:PHD/YefM family antitoxin component YafN of YafNO toxin-antitoxin module